MLWVKGMAKFLGMIGDSGSIFNMDDNFEHSLGRLSDMTLTRDGAINTNMSLSGREQIVSHFDLIKDQSAIALQSNQAQLQYNLGENNNDFFVYVNAINDYVMNLEYLLALYQNIIGPVSGMNYQDYQGLMDWIASLNANFSYVAVENPNSYVDFQNRLNFHGLGTNNFNILSNNILSSDRGLRSLIVPIMFDVQAVVDEFSLDWSDITNTEKLLFLFGEHDYRFYHAFNSGPTGICQFVFQHLTGSNDDGSGNCVIIPHITRAMVLELTQI